MATLDDLQAAIEQLLDLDEAGAVLQLNSETREHAFEAYIFSLLLTAVNEAGGESTLVGITSGDDPTTVVFRGSPGQLGSTAQDYVYASCSLGTRQFELHVCVQYAGGSGAHHEVDVSICDATAANRARQSGQQFPSVRRLYGAIECKLYDTSLNTALGRTFVGMTHDCGTLRLKALVTNGESATLAQYLSHKQRGDYFFNLTPLQPAVEERFVQFMSQRLRQWAAVS